MEGKRKESLVVDEEMVDSFKKQKSTEDEREKWQNKHRLSLIYSSPMIQFYSPGQIRKKKRRWQT